ncbi:MAG: hypothetical protein ACREXR_17620, partial [Gammaproteobacteria bacterium]
LELLCKGLIDNGLSPALPAALVERGTTLRQRVICAKLERLPKEATECDVQPPMLVIIGEVVTLREKLAWFESTQQGGLLAEPLFRSSLERGVPDLKR